MNNSSKLNINCCPIRGITPKDYLIIFADEATVPSAAGVSGYVWAGPPHLLPDGTVSVFGEPNDEWIEDITNLKILIESNFIDINKVLLFHVYMAGNPPQGSEGILLPLYPTINVPPNYEMPISNEKIISPTPRNQPARLVNGQALTGQWILDKVTEKLNPIINTNDKNRIIIFVDDSPSLTFPAVAVGVNGFMELVSDTFRTKLVLCNTERYIRWIISTFSGNPTCS